MLFNSYFFTLVFLPLILAAWWLPRFSIRSRLTFLIAASYFFYGWWDYRFVTLLVFSTVVDFTAGHRIYASSRPRWRTLWLSVSLAANLGLLLFFAVVFKIRGIPAGSLELETGRGHQLLESRLAALRAITQHGLAHFLDDFQFVPAALAAVFVNRHRKFSNSDLRPLEIGAKGHRMQARIIATGAGSRITEQRI